MAQNLFVKVTMDDGKEVMKKVIILRSWQDASGAQIFLHHTGVYGYKDGSPVKTQAELKIIKTPAQKSAANAWWKTRGEKLSKEFYTAKAEAEMERAKTYQHNVVEDNADLDQVQYFKDTPDGEQGPFSWTQLFPTRPDWWGQAEAVKFGDCTYKQAGIDLDDGEKDTPEPLDPETDKTKTPDPKKDQGKDKKPADKEF